METRRGERKCDDRQCHAAERSPGMKAENESIVLLSELLLVTPAFFCRGMQSYVLGCEVIARMSVNTLLMSF